MELFSIGDTTQSLQKAATHMQITLLDVAERPKLRHHVWLGGAAAWRTGPPAEPAVGGVLQCAGLLVLESWWQGFVTKSSTMSNCHSVLCLCGALLISEKSGKRMKHIVFGYKTRCILQNKVSPHSPQELFGRGRCSVDPDGWCKCFLASAFPWEQTSSSSSAGEAVAFV